MKRKTVGWPVRLLLAALALSTSVLAQVPAPAHLSGFINDYTAATLKAAGPWEVRGEWSLAVKGDSNQANFSATLTMIRSDLWVIANNANANDPSARSPHTHHITVVGGTVIPQGNGFEVDGLATITASGTQASFSPSHVQIRITGGSDVALSNISLTFLDAGAAGHFGDQPLEGVVRAKAHPSSDSD